MTLQNCEIFASVVFLLISKIVSFFVEFYRLSMFNKSGSVLTSIPEKNEEEDIKKWVPKKKHEVLKAKYKCLKKLFQIYDASVIGILPENGLEYESEVVEEEQRRTRRKRSRRTKTDACAGTGERASGDADTDTDKASTIATAVMRELKMTQCSCTSTQIDSETKYDGYDATQASSRNEVSQQFEGISNTRLCNNYEYADSRKTERSTETAKESEGVQVSEMEQHPIPYLMMNEKPKLTRFQCFIQRIFGIRPERCYKTFVRPNGHIYAASDNNIMIPYSEKRRRRGLRFRRARRAKRAVSEAALAARAQGVQRACLADTTPRACPVMGCRMIFYGIINYNDHLNLCHFTARRYVCHYCHEGFEQEQDKCEHENEHIGIPKLSSSYGSSRQQRVASVTQTEPEASRDVPDDKLKKIVSFFDKIADPEQMLTEMKKNRFSESNLHSSKEDTATESAIDDNSETDKRTVSCVNLPRKKRSPPDLPGTPVSCHYCGETFHHRRQLSLHVDLEHRMHDKFSKFHSCAGIVNPRRRAEECKPSKVKPSEDDLRRKSEESLSYEPSTNIVYYTSMESVAARKPANCRWEPGTRVIRL